MGFTLRKHLKVWLGGGWVIGEENLALSGPGAKVAPLPVLSA